MRNAATHEEIRISRTLAALEERRAALHAQLEDLDREARELTRRQAPSTSCAPLTTARDPLSPTRCHERHRRPRANEIAAAATRVLTQFPAAAGAGRISADSTTLAYARQLAATLSTEDHLLPLSWVAEHDHYRGDHSG